MTPCGRGHNVYQLTIVCHTVHVTRANRLTIRYLRWTQVDLLKLQIGPILVRQEIHCPGGQFFLIFLESASMSLSSPQSHVHMRTNTTEMATTAAHRYALAKLDVHVATMVSVH